MVKKNQIDERAALKAIENDPEVKAEFSRMEKLFSAMPEQSRELLRPLMARAAFLAVLIDRLEADILKNGWQQRYTNGEHQSGLKKSVSCDLHGNYVKIYTGIMKQLYSALGHVEILEEPDELERFLSGEKSFDEYLKMWKENHNANIPAWAKQKISQMDEFDLF